MAITKTLPEIPATPAPPDGMPRRLPSFLASGPLRDRVAEFNRLADVYDARAAAHRGIANQAALSTAVREDDLSHATAVRAGQDDPGPVNVTAWKEAEETARRAVAGARDAIRMTWQDLLNELADEPGDKLLAEIEGRRDDARARLAEAVEVVRGIMLELDISDDQAAYANRGHGYAVAWVAQPHAPMRPDGQTARWPQGDPTGQPKPLYMTDRQPLPDLALKVLAEYRQQ